MPRQGLCRERVVEAAVALIEERGAERFSMGELAKRLCDGLGEPEPRLLLNRLPGSTTRCTG